MHKVFPPGVFVAEELEARGWTPRDLALRMGGDPAIDQLTVDMLIHVPDKNMLLDQETANGLGRAFGTSPDLWLNLDRQWRGDD